MEFETDYSEDYKAIKLFITIALEDAKYRSYPISDIAEDVMDEISKRIEWILDG